ncbi:MAG: trypsin-like peptidase domain-containing protein [Polyangiaceae bacterium]|nr:trypsin-like peptidase domain-containing protein [Polyangiaceae bacterium]MCW5789392.1 trypsin-like peptidase domain-containing protein [Polyangiaceae bacterium]
MPASASAAVAPPDAGVAPPLSPGARIEDERNSIQIFREVAPSVAYVTQKRQVMDRFAMRALEVPSGSGSAFIWDDAGHVVTNFHVIAGAGSLTVTLHDQNTYEAKVVGAEPRKDVAVLALIGAPKASLVPIPRNPKGTTADLEVGQKAIAIGNPFGLDHTLTTGIVSALGREVQGVGGVTIRDMIQTDAAINPGNSGGPLLDSSGRLIGMNTMIFSKSGASAGIGFAVPLSIINRVVPQLIEKGVATQVGIGVQIDPQGRLERRAGIRGVVVLSATPGSPAEQAGLAGVKETARGIQIGDVIVSVNDKKVVSYDDLYNHLDQYEVGQRVKLGVSRGGQERVVELALVQVN